MLIAPIAQEEYSYTLHMTGFASTLPADDQVEDVVAQLRKVVEEVTGKPLPEAPAAKIGFY